MNISALLRSAEKLKRQHLREPIGDVVDSEEWQWMRTFTLNFLENRYPDAYLAVVAGIDQIEAKEGARAQTIKSRRHGSKIPWLETNKGRLHSMMCELATYGVLAPFLEARIAMAEELGRLVKDEQNEQH